MVSLTKNELTDLVLSLVTIHLEKDEELLRKTGPKLCYF